MNFYFELFETTGGSTMPINLALVKYGVSFGEDRTKLYFIDQTTIIVNVSLTEFNNKMEAYSKLIMGALKK